MCRRPCAYTGTGDAADAAADAHTVRHRHRRALHGSPATRVSLATLMTVSRVACQGGPAHRGDAVLRAEGDPAPARQVAHRPAAGAAQRHHRRALRGAEGSLVREHRWLVVVEEVAQLLLRAQVASVSGMRA